jgi:hypothetical protein
MFNCRWNSYPVLGHGPAALVQRVLTLLKTFMVLAPRTRTDATMAKKIIPAIRLYSMAVAPLLFRAKLRIERTFAPCAGPVDERDYSRTIKEDLLR